MATKVDDAGMYSWTCSLQFPRIFFFSLGVSIIWGRRNGYDYHSSTLSCPVHPPPLTPHFPYLFYMSLFLVFSLPLRLFPDTGASNILLRVCPWSLLVTCPYHFSLFYVNLFVTGATFTDRFTCSFLVIFFRDSALRANPINVS